MAITKSDVEPKKNQASCSSSIKLVESRLANCAKVANLINITVLPDSNRLCRME